MFLFSDFDLCPHIYTHYNIIFPTRKMNNNEITARHPVRRSPIRDPNRIVFYYYHCDNWELPGFARKRTFLIFFRDVLKSVKRNMYYQRYMYNSGLDCSVWNFFFFWIFRNQTSLWVQVAITDLWFICVQPCTFQTPI